ncbi:phosphotransferase family protein [Sphingopyxis indica]|uniref:Phosphotransferase enzyme family protein n=1 Tax=Sphingopyxis indica TaxID=436663 RepID=A0A239GX34_9SPHN|nr:phosphotransferase [Sphingopyxis indica]SNS73697.1 Phosphotransferase enzyme family protein [Sphingopyxis indica]
MSFPTSPEAMTPAWIAARLGQPAGALRGFTTAKVGTGQMCDSFRLTLDWAEGIDDAPASIVAKCPSHDAASRNIAALTGTYVKEVSWYRELAADSGVAAPHCYHAQIAPDGVDFILLLADLAPARPGDQLAGMGLDALGPCIDAAAGLHALLWNDARLDALPWLSRDSGDLVRALFPQLYLGFRERYAGRLAPDILGVGAALVERLEAWLTRTPAARTIVHGDLRLDNILFAPDPRECWLVDWQTLGRGSGAADLAYLVGTSIADPVERAAADRPAFDRWLSALRAQGIEADADALWDDYRVGALSGYFMAVFASMNVERTPRGDEMFAVMAERPARQALALGSLDLL